jgi:hypothetical protein
MPRFTVAQIDAAGKGTGARAGARWCMTRPPSVADRCHGALPQRPALLDVVLLGVATHELSRLVATERVTSPIRAPLVDDPEHEARREAEGRPASEERRSTRT